MTQFILIAGALLLMAVLMSATGGDSRPVQPIVSIVDEPGSSRIDLTVTVIMLVILLLGLVLLKITP